jgi:SAM-dependent methyltransferase
MIPLSQRGRSSMEFLGALQRYAGGVLRDQAHEDFFADPEGASLGRKPIGERPEAEMDAIVAKAEEIANRSANYRFNRFYQRLVAEQVYDKGIPYVEEHRAKVEPMLKAPLDMSQAGTLTLHPEVEEPASYAGVEWHLMPGSWDGYDLSPALFTAAIGPHVFRHGGYAAVVAGANILAHREMVLRQLPKSDYARIYEMGCGGSSTLGTARKVFPNAELVGGDLSRALLEGGHRAAAIMKLNIHLVQEDAQKTTHPDASFDAVVSYAVFHEMDDEVAYNSLEEAFRIMKPGADIVISDPPPFRAVDPFLAVVYNWETEHRGEPHFTASIKRSLPAMMREIGFVDVQEYALGPGEYPWVTRGRKPEQA